MKMNIKKLSEITGYSPATVSNALNNKRGVNKETAKRIFEAAVANGYLSGMRIDSIKLVVYKKSGTIVSDTPFFSALIEGVEKEGRSMGYETAICNLNRDSPDFEKVRDQLISASGCGLLLLATEMDEEDFRPFQDALAPLVVLDNWFEDAAFDSVLISNTDSACQAVKYLIAKGHREIGYLQGNIRIKNFFYREEGLRRAFGYGGIQCGGKYFFPLTPTMEGAYEDMLALLRTKPQLPTAFFADNDIIALGAMRALQEMGWRVPQDVSIVGFDGLPYGAISFPALTTIQVPKEEMGRQAVRRLMEAVRGDAGCKMKVQVCGSFVERDSVGEVN